MQDKDRSLLEGEPAIRPLELIAVGDGVAPIRGRRSVDRQDPDDGRPGTSPCGLVVTRMDEDPMDPRLEAVRIAKMREPPPGEHEGVLQRVLGETAVAQDPVGDRIQRITDLVHQDGERLAITRASPLDEVSIQPSTSLAAAPMAADYPL